MTVFETRNNQRTYDTDTHKVVPKDAVVLEFDARAETTPRVNPASTTPAPQSVFVSLAEAADYLGVRRDDLDALLQPIPTADIEDES